METGEIGLSKNPFQRSPELDDACLPNSVASLVAELQSSLRAPRGVSVVTGDSRCGKSFVAGIFARRIAGLAEVALIGEPTSSVAAIARDALSELDASARDFGADSDWIDALRSHVACRSGEGLLTVIVVDDAERLSPQTLEDLAGLFEAATPLRLHVFLFGRARLLDCLQSGADSALQEHLLKLCRLEPLGVRESVRYLERRLAMVGSELSRLLNDEAIDEVVQKSGGRLIDLETVAAGALVRAQARGRTRASADDVMAAPPSAAAEEEEGMAARQQPLKFRLTDMDEDETASARWDAGDEEEDEAVQWGVDDDEDDDEWHTDSVDEDEEKEPAMQWTRGRSRHHEVDDADAAFARPRKPAIASAQRRVAGRAVLSVVACLGLIWAANRLPGPTDDAPRGRDAQMFAEPLGSRPEQIMRLASTVAAADADSQVTAWREYLAARPQVAEEEKAPAAETVVAAAPPAAVAPSAAPTPAAAGVPARNETETVALAVAAAGEQGDLMVGPMLPAFIPTAQLPEQLPKAAEAVAAPAPKPAEVASLRARPAAPAAKAAAKSRAGEVYTVQLGAFRARSNAEELAGELRGKTTRILREDGLYRVMSGSFANKREAALHETSLRRAGYRTYVRTAVF